MRCLVAFSGGLDSQLAVALLRQQGIEVAAVHFYSPLDDGRELATATAAKLNLPLLVLEATAAYFDLIRRPRFGYSAGAAPCIDERIYWFRRAQELLAGMDAQFLASGEVLGQRLPSQTRRACEVIEHHAGLSGRLLRPLSAQLLPPTSVEASGQVDRSRLLALQGRGRKQQLQLAAELGIDPVPPPRGNPALSEPHLAAKAFDLLKHQSTTGRWDFELLPCGRHFRLNACTKLIIGRSREENRQLEQAFAAAGSRPVGLLVPENFAGPSALLIGDLDEHHTPLAAALVLQWGKPQDAAEPHVVLHTHEHPRRTIPALPLDLTNVSPIVGSKP